MGNIYNIAAILAVVVWLVFGFLMAGSWSECCGREAQESITETPADTIPSEEEDTFTCEGLVLCFRPGLAEPEVAEGFDRFRDSIVSLVADNQKLQIIGLYGSEESNPTDCENLGLARAHAIRTMFEEAMEDDQLETGAQLTVGRSSAVISGDRVRFEVVDQEAEFVPASTLIYFPFASAQRIDDPIVERYLRQLSMRLSESHEPVLITGHTDNTGTAEANMELGMKRAQAIRDYMVSQGVSFGEIRVESRGEREPVASNNSEEGRARNRRAELIILNE